MLELTLRSYDLRESNPMTCRRPSGNKIKTRTIPGRMTYSIFLSD